MNRLATVAIVFLAILATPVFAQDALSVRKFSGSLVPPTRVMRGNVSRHIWAPGELSSPIGTTNRPKIYKSENSCKPCADSEMNSLGLVSSARPPGKKLAARQKRKTVVAKKKILHVVAKKDSRVLAAKIDDTVYVTKSNRPARRTKNSSVSKCARLMQQAQAHMDRGDTESADRLLKAALNAEPGSRCLRTMVVGVSMCRARSSVSCSNYECAARRLRDVLYLDPNHKGAHDLLDNVYSATGLNPQNGQQREQIAQWLAANGRQVGAVVEYREAAKLTNSPGTLIGLANAALKTNQSGLALSSLRKAVGLDPFNSRSWQQIGFLEESRGQVQNAASAFLEAARMNPGDPISIEKSLELTQMLSRKLPGSIERKLDVARAYLVSDQSDKAAALYSQVTQLQPASPSFQDWLSVESRNSALKQAAVQQTSRGQQLAANDLFKFLNEGPPPGEGIAIDAAKAKLKSSCNCN